MYDMYYLHMSHQLETASARVNKSSHDISEAMLLMSDLTNALEMLSRHLSENINCGMTWHERARLARLNEFLTQERMA